jgi:hypothetical protein
MSLLKRAGKVAEPAIPAGMDLFEATNQVMADFAAWEPPERPVPPSGDVDSIEVVQVATGPQASRPSEPGVHMTWHQGTNRFGLVASITKLAEQSRQLQSVAFYLHLMVDEPHGPTSDGSRKWFFDLPY